MILRACMSTDAIKKQNKEKYLRNKDKILARQKDKFRENPGIHHHVTIDEYKRLLSLQEEKCAACKLLPDGESLQFDHDHECCAGRHSCGKCIRGLLCNRCNTALGFLNDSIPMLESLIVYLKTTRKNGRRD